MFDLTRMKEELDKSSFCFFKLLLAEKWSDFVSLGKFEAVVDGGSGVLVMRVVVATFERVIEVEWEGGNVVVDG